jgi:hypothetical protein
MPLDEAYFVWLYSQVGSVKLRNKAKTYWKLLRLLFQKEFTWADIEKDGNRAQDGKNLRFDFFRETGEDPENHSDWLDEGCSFLELLIALAWKLAWESDIPQEVWFWQLIGNLGLIDCTDAHPPDPTFVDRVLDNVIDRNYGKNGSGGLFPLSRTHDDQRDTELWYQLQAYLLERI